MTKKTKREFKLSTLSLNNSVSVFILSFLLILLGLYSYHTMPKESFPEIVFPIIYVQTSYPGNTPKDIENLITRPLEKEIKNIDGIKTLNSESVQDVSVINVEFNIDLDREQALHDIKDAVDRAISELPTDLDQKPIVMDIDLSRIPILNINLSGDYSIDQLVDYAEYLQDEIEEMIEISEATITGDKEKEVQINIDLPKLKTNQLSFEDIANALVSENVNIGAGDILLGNTRRSIRTNAEFENMDDIRNVIVKHENNNIVYLKDVADVYFTYKEVESFARLDGKSVVSLNIIKKGGENLLEATDKIREILQKAQKEKFPDGLKITITNDQSTHTRNQISNLENSIISGVILVVLVLLFFLGLRNAVFVGLSIPLSMLISFLILSALGITLNFIVLFSLILALGMLVDNAIVTIENIYRLYEEEGLTSFEAVKQGVGEVAAPIISSTLTTLAAFFPLLFWDDIIGEFMGYLPKTLIIVLGSSLFAALVINPVIVSIFIKKQNLENYNIKYKRAVISALIFGVLGILFVLSKVYALGNLMIVVALLIILFSYMLKPLSIWFQTTLLVRLENAYSKTLTLALSGSRPLFIIIGTTALMILSVGFYFGSNPKVQFFPVNEPNYINIFVETPLGTDVQVTDSITRIIEKKLNEILEPNKDLVKSVVTNVGAETTSQGDFEGGGGQNTPNKSRITVSFVEYQHRNGTQTTNIQRRVIDELNGYLPGVTITVQKEQNGPHLGKAINIEIAGEEFGELLKISEDIKRTIEAENIAGIEGLQIDLETNKPEMLIKIDRERSRRLGVSTQQVALVLRTALYGREAGKYKEGEDDYPIEIRLKEKYRYNMASLMNQLITFRSQSSGKIVQVPISAVADYEFNNSFNSIKRKDSERLITVYSNVVEGYNQTEVNNKIKAALEDYELPESYALRFTGAQQEQQQSSQFLTTALLIAVSLITIILVSQFNSAIKPFIIIMIVLFSTIGVFLGLGIFRMDFIVIMTGIGIVSLAGVVVNNGIVLIDFIELSRNRLREKKGISDGELSDKDLIEAIKTGGKTRLRPVLLTAITTVLGLLPLAIGLNIDFFGLLSNYDANIYFGGENSVFWSPMAWTVIFGLVFATFLTLVVVPVMYLTLERLTRTTRVLFKILIN